VDSVQACAQRTHTDQQQRLIANTEHVLLQCLKVIYAYMAIATFLIFFFMTGGILIRILQALHIHLDAITVVFVLSNLALVGPMILFFQPSPLLMKQVRNQVALLASWDMGIVRPSNKTALRLQTGVPMIIRHKNLYADVYLPGSGNARRRACVPRHRLAVHDTVCVHKHGSGHAQLCCACHCGPPVHICVQLYLGWTGVVVAYVFSSIPAVTTWVLLAAMAIYDLIAVLTPHGPLQMLVTLAVDRGDEIPALVYEAREVRRRRRPAPSAAATTTTNSSDRVNGGPGRGAGPVGEAWEYGEQDSVVAPTQHHTVCFCCSPWCCSLPRGSSPTTQHIHVDVLL
jgi:hypothetical protein